MDFDERLGWLVLGCLIGFTLGYVVRYLQEIKEELKVVEKAVTRSKNEDGLTRKPLILDIVLLVVVAMTVWASFQTAAVNSRLEHTIECITNYNTYQGRAVAHRDHAIESGTDSEIRLWTQYGELYAQAKKDPSKIADAQAKLAQAIRAHRDSLIELQERRDEFPYAPPNVLENCQNEG